MIKKIKEKKHYCLSIVFLTILVSDIDQHRMSKPL